MQNKQHNQQLTEVKKKETMTKPKIFNLSNKVLSQQHVNVLRRDFKFPPTPLPNKIDLKNDVHQFLHKLCLLESFLYGNRVERREIFC